MTESAKDTHTPKIQNARYTPVSNHVCGTVRRRRAYFHQRYVSVLRFKIPILVLKYPHTFSTRAFFGLALQPHLNTRASHINLLSNTSIAIGTARGLLKFKLTQQVHYSLVETEILCDKKFLNMMRICRVKMTKYAPICTKTLNTYKCMHQKRFEPNRKKLTLVSLNLYSTIDIWFKAVKL